MSQTTVYTRLRSFVRLAAVGALIATGCSGEDHAVETFPVSGQVLYKGQPATGAKVIFFFANEELRGQRIPTPQATVDEDGDFQIGCFEAKDGAPAGEYGIAMVWRREIANRKTGGDERPPDRLQGRYSNPRRTGLKATIVEGENTLPAIELK